MLAQSSDGTRVAYEVHGDGPALLLLQGLQEPRQQWQTLGYVERLVRDFTVITMDRRGIGESDMPAEPDAYSLDRVLDDVYTVADVCRFERFLVWGHSLGGSIALQLAARSDRIAAAVIAGSFFGAVYPRERVDEIVHMWEAAMEARASGRLDELGVHEEEREMIEQVNIPALVACWRAVSGWPVVEPEQIRCPTFVYAGSLDERVANPLMERRQDILAAGIKLHIFDGLDHEGEVCERDVVLPSVLAFLSEMRLGV